MFDFKVLAVVVRCGAYFGAYCGTCFGACGGIYGGAYGWVCGGLVGEPMLDIRGGKTGWAQSPQPVLKGTSQVEGFNPSVCFVIFQ